MGGVFSDCYIHDNSNNNKKNNIYKEDIIKIYKALNYNALTNYNSVNNKNKNKYKINNFMHILSKQYNSIV